MQTNKPIAIIFLLVIVVMMVILFVVPAYRQFSQAKGRLAELQNQDEGQAAYRAEIANIMAQLNQRSEALAKLDSALPAEFSVAPIVQFLGKKASDNGLAMSSVELSPDQLTSYHQMVELNPQQVKTLAFVTHVRGPYTGIKNFLGAVEASSRVFEIRSLALEPLPAAPSPRASLPQYEITLEIQTYAY